MKKLVLLLTVAFSVSMFSCGADAKTEAAAEEAAPVATEEVAAPDTCCQADTCAACDSVAPAAE